MPRTYTRPIRQGNADLPADAYWRALWAMQDDWVTAMLSERTLQALAMGMSEAAVDHEATEEGMDVVLTGVLEESGMGRLLTALAQAHIVRTVLTVWFPTPVREPVLEAHP